MYFEYLIGIGHLLKASFLIDRSHPYRWGAVVSWLNHLILAVDLCDSSAQHRMKHVVDPLLDCIIPWLPMLYTCTTCIISSPPPRMWYPITSWSKLFCSYGVSTTRVGFWSCKFSIRTPPPNPLMILCQPNILEYASLIRKNQFSWYNGLSDRLRNRKRVQTPSYCVHFWANTLGKGMNPLILPAMG